jgi:signal transduction histidine kinase
LANPFGIEGLEATADVLTLALLLLPVMILASAAGLVVRFRRSRGMERLQLKWLATAGAFVATLYALAMIATFAPTYNDQTPAWAMAFQDAALVSFAVIPLSIGIAVLKHQLYGIDVVINKSVVFGALATFITIVYVVIVVGVGSLLGRADRPNLVLSIAATAVVAVAFEPVRDRVQRFANRLVYGARATPYEVLSDFADRMGGTYDAAELLPMMARTVGQGVGASRVGVWLTEGPGLELEATWPPAQVGQAEPTAVGDVEGLPGDRVVPVRHHDELLGAITVVKPAGEALTPAEDKLLDDVSAQAGLVLRNVRLIEDLRGSRQRLVRTQDEERRRLERNLHDGAQQSLVAVALMIRLIRGRLDPESDTESQTVAQTLDEAADQLSAAIDELRVLARGIHPVILSERGLGPALSSLAERSPVPVVVDYRLDERPPADLEATMYYVAAEALANVAKHAHANEVAVRVTRSDSQLVLEVEDDGVGGCDTSRGTGLLGLADRVSVVDGTLAITSPPGQGTRLVCSLPLPASVRRTDVAADQPRTTQPLGAGQ